MTYNYNLVGILLAAGQSRRFGANNKLLYKINGEPMAALAARNLKAALPNSIAIIKPNDLKTRTLLENEGLHVMECQNAEQGMGYSLAHAIKNSWHAKGWLITLADMPFIHQKTIRKIAGAIKNNASIAVPRHNYQRGHPVGFSHHYRHSLSSLNNDRGAHEIIEKNKAEIMELDVDDPGVLIDFDTEPLNTSHAK